MLEGTLTLCHAVKGAYPGIEKEGGGGGMVCNFRVILYTFRGSGGMPPNPPLKFCDIFMP